MQNKMTNNNPILKSEYNYLEISCSTKQEEDVLATIWDYNVSGVELEELSDRKSRIRVYCEVEQNLESISACLESGNFGTIAVSRGTAYSKEWKDKLFGWFDPVNFGNLRIVPFSLKDRGPKAGDIIIYPGRGYGTGSHATTSMCMSLLEELIVPDMRLLDFGTGSGILAIAAIQWGASSVFAIDSDPDAVENAAINIELNGVKERIEIDSGSVHRVPEEKYELIMANLNSGIIEGILSEGLGEKLTATGKMILSGIRIDHVEGISAVLKTHSLAEHKWRREGKWTSVVVSRKARDNQG